MRLMKYLFFVHFFAMASVLPAQPPQLWHDLDSIIQIARTTSLYRDQIDWPAVTDSMHKLSTTALTFEDLTPAFNYLLESLGDEHGRVFYDNQVVAYYYSGTLKPHQEGINLEMYNEVQAGRKYPFEALLLKDGIGYLRIPGMPMGDNLAMAKEIQDQVCRLIAEGADRWIIDLRFNGGGNLNPMAEGLAVILGDGAVGGAAGLTARENITWEIRDQDFYNWGYSIHLPALCHQVPSQKVAILTSVYTASSGEALAVMFKGLEHTRFFGSKTLGMVTGTNWVQINDKVAVTLSTNYYQDRDGNVYRDYVDVDEEIQCDYTSETYMDLCVQKAVDWLQAK